MDVNKPKHVILPLTPQRKQALSNYDASNLADIKTPVFSPPTKIVPTSTRFWSGNKDTAALSLPVFALENIKWATENDNMHHPIITICSQGLWVCVS